MADLLERLGQAGEHRLRDLVADALGDPSLELAYWLEDRGRWVDADGHAVALPDPDDPARAWSAVEHEGRRVGAIVYDRALCEDPALVRSVAAAAGLAVQNERLQAQLRLRVEELRDSRARIVQAGMAERRRLEGDLHDGAQQELATALAELRELARGIHPAVLSDRGLDAALEALAGRSPVAVAFTELPPERLPPAAEAAAYFVVAEALTNVAITRRRRGPR